VAPWAFFFSAGGVGLGENCVVFFGWHFVMAYNIFNY